MTYQNASEYESILQDASYASTFLFDGRAGQHESRFYANIIFTHINWRSRVEMLKHYADDLILFFLLLRTMHQRLPMIKPLIEKWKEREKKKTNCVQYFVCRTFRPSLGFWWIEFSFTHSILSWWSFVLCHDVSVYLHPNIDLWNTFLIHNVISRFQFD